MKRLGYGGPCGPRIIALHPQAARGAQRRGTMPGKELAGFQTRTGLQFPTTSDHGSVFFPLYFEVVGRVRKGIPIRRKAFAEKSLSCFDQAPMPLRYAQAGSGRHSGSGRAACILHFLCTSSSWLHRWPPVEHCYLHPCFGPSLLLKSEMILSLASANKMWLYFSITQSPLIASRVSHFKRKSLRCVYRI